MIPELKKSILRKALEQLLEDFEECKQGPRSADGYPCPTPSYFNTRREAALDKADGAIKSLVPMSEKDHFF